MPIKRCLKKVLLINLVNPYMLATKICKEEEENVDSDLEIESYLRFSTEIVEINKRLNEEM